MADLGASLHVMGSALTAPQEGANLALGRSDARGIYAEAVVVTSGPPFSVVETELMNVPSVPFPPSPIDNRFERLASGEEVGTNPPTIGNFAPPVGTTLGRSQAVAFDITDPDGDLQRGAVWVTQGQDVLVCHDGDTFRGGFSGTRTPITDGFRYSVTRDRGWTAAPVFTFHVTDSGGNEAV